MSDKPQRTVLKPETLERIESYVKADPDLEKIVQDYIKNKQGCSREEALTALWLLNVL